MSTYPAAGDPLAAVLFDMDGLLVDTESVWFAVESAIMERLGSPWGPQQQADLVGGSLERSARYMVAHAGVDLPWQRVGTWMVEGMVERLAGGVRVQPGALELLGELEQAGVPRALVTSSQQLILDAVLATVGRHHFEFTISGDDVTRHKPDPQPYLLAVGRLGAPASSAVVLEDSPTGVAAAEAAGCPVVMVPSVVRLEEAPGRMVVDSLRDLDVERLRRLAGAASAAT